jgi:hypothetical protein
MSNDTFQIYGESDPLAAREFCKDFLAIPAGKKFLQIVDSTNAQQAWDEIVIAKFRKIYGNDPIVFGDLLNFVNDLLLSGALRAPEPEPEKQLSPSQQKWSEYRIFSEEHSMAECKARAPQDPGYREFVSKNLEREAVNRASKMVNLNANRTATTQFVSAELERFVEDYRSMPMDKVRKLSNAGTDPDGKHAADHFNALLNKAIELGQI